MVKLILRFSLSTSSIPDTIQETPFLPSYVVIFLSTRPGSCLRVISWKKTFTMDATFKPTFFENLGYQLLS